MTTQLLVVLALSSALVAATSYGEQEKPPAADDIARPCIVSENLAYKEVSAQTPARELAQGLVEGWKNRPGIAS